MHFKIGDLIVIKNVPENKQHFWRPEHKKLFGKPLTVVRERDSEGCIQVKEIPDRGFYEYRFELFDPVSEKDPNPICIKIRQMERRRKEAGYAF